MPFSAPSYAGQQHKRRRLFAKLIERHNLGISLGGVFGICHDLHRGLWRVVLIVVVLVGFKPKTEFDGRINKGLDRVIGDVEWFCGIPKVEGNRKAVVGDSKPNFL